MSVRTYMTKKKGPKVEEGKEKVVTMGDCIAEILLKEKKERTASKRATGTMQYKKVARKELEWMVEKEQRKVTRERRVTIPYRVVKRNEEAPGKGRDGRGDKEPTPTGMLISSNNPSSSSSSSLGTFSSSSSLSSAPTATANLPTSIPQLSTDVMQFSMQSGAASGLSMSLSGFNSGIQSAPGSINSSGSDDSAVLSTAATNVPGSDVFAPHALLDNTVTASPGLLAPASFVSAPALSLPVPLLYPNPPSLHSLPVPYLNAMIFPMAFNLLPHQPHNPLMMAALMEQQQRMWASLMSNASQNIPQ